MSCAPTRCCCCTTATVVCLLQLSHEINSRYRIPPTWWTPSAALVDIPPPYSQEFKCNTCSREGKCTRCKADDADRLEREKVRRMRNAVFVGRCVSMSTFRLPSLLLYANVIRFSLQHLSLPCSHPVWGSRRSNRRIRIYLRSSHPSTLPFCVAQELPSAYPPPMLFGCVKVVILIGWSMVHVPKRCVRVTSAEE